MSNKGGPASIGPARVDALVQALRNGSFRKEACAKVRIDESTLRNWLHKGAAGEEGYVEFRTRVLQAEAECIDEQVYGILEAGKQDPKARQWFLERKDPRRFGQQIRVEVDKAHDELLSAAESILPPETFEKLLETVLLRREGGASAPTDSGEEAPSPAGEPGEPRRP